jgi:30S ribosomal protein S31
MIMGKGDKKTKRGKIVNGSYGVRRPKIKKRPTTKEKISVDKKAKA